MIAMVINVICVLMLVRYFEVKLFLRKVSKLCNKYDWKYINEHPECLLDKMKNENGYYLDSEWSAYNFLFLKGPSPKQMYLSFKSLTLNNVYDKEVLERLNKYEIK